MWRNDNSTNTQRSSLLATNLHLLTSQFPYFLETLCPYFKKYACTSVLPTDFRTKYSQIWTGGQVWYTEHVKAHIPLDGLEWPLVQRWWQTELILVLPSLLELAPPVSAALPLLAEEPVAGSSRWNSGSPAVVVAAGQHSPSFPVKTISFVNTIEFFTPGM